MVSPALVAVTNPPPSTRYVVVRGILQDLSRTTILDVPTLTGFIENTDAGAARRIPFTLRGDNLSFFESYAPRWITEGETVGFFGTLGDVFAVIGPDQISLSRTRSSNKPGWLDRVLAMIPRLPRRFRPKAA